jgi:predicted outer membrane repeat protein
MPTPYPLRASIAACTALLAMLAGADRAPAQDASAGNLRIAWEVKNRFRLFREENDFLRQAAAMQGGSVLAAEQALAAATDGRGWARDTVVRLCVNVAGLIQEQCIRDGVRENFLAPVDHRIGAKLLGALPAGATCTWTFDDGTSGAQTFRMDCGAEVSLRVRYGSPTIVTVQAALTDGTTAQASGEILVRDLLIAGLGDSIAAGEGNPDRPVSLSDDGFCFRQLFANVRSEYFRPGRVGYDGDKSCDAVRAEGADSMQWNKLSARWMSAACHRSLYGYQLRTALALALGAPHVAVTFVPLACTGATIDAGLFGTQRARELNCGENTCPRTVPGQIGQLRGLLDRARRRDAARQVDLVLLTVGANDIDFSGLVANVIINARGERALFSRSGIIATVDSAERALVEKLPQDFVRLRAALKPLVGGRLERVVYVSYAHPALGADGEPCPGGRDGFDVHPAFDADGERMRKVADFVHSRFLPQIKNLATCDGGAICGDGDAMTFVDAHQPAFLAHGICARGAIDPDFDKDCFSPSGESFNTSPVDGATQPLVCERSASEFRAYAPRARWIRTANDSYFAAMTFPQGVPAMIQAADIHDATWGILSAVYGGAVHPTAEGHAATADAALAEARRVLGLAVVESPVSAAPLPAPEPAPR